ncbi:MAG: serine hydrolase domain-containing protein [Pseudodonghicola sp.]
MTTVPNGFAEKVNALFAAFDRPDSPGAVLLVRHNGQEVFCNAWGAENLNCGKLLSRQSIVRIGSQSKQFTVLLALMLEAEGKLSMADPVAKQLSDLPAFANEVTLAHLASNTSGWRDHFQALVLSGLSLYAPSPRQATLDVITRQEALNFPPGSAVSYSNSGFVMLSEIIERIEGKPLAASLEERIFAPLGMTRTALIDRDGRAVPELASHYCKEADGWYAHNWGLPIGGEGGIASTVDDMALWLANYTDPKVGTPQMLARMQTPPRFPNGSPSSYGMGLVIHDYHGRRFIGHGGSVAGGRSEGGRFVDAGLDIILLGNCDTITPLPLLRRVADLWFDEGPGPALELSPGRYRQQGGRGVIEIRHREGYPEIMSAGTGFDLLDCTPPEGGARESGLINTYYRPAPETAPEAAVEAIFCGQSQIYRPIAPRVQAAAPLSGCYRQPVQQFEVTIGSDLTCGSFTLRSPLGVFRGYLAAVDDRLWLLRAGDLPASGLPGAEVPWMAVIEATDTGFLLDTARNKAQAFEKD